ncbi:DeoR family transcriptional regulator [Candidatus Roizmanbacteria bacterium]|nr:DeoR family transcriptional regulator [Candidatus Roizmanbacteria bacterium]
MKSFFYAKSQVLNEQISIIEDLKKAILLKPLSPKEKTKLRWFALIKRIHSSFLIVNKPVTLEIIKKLFSTGGKTNLTYLEKEVLSYKEALDFLYQNWLVNNKTVTPEELIHLYKIAFNKKLAISYDNLEESLKYFQISTEHPIIQASLALIIIQTLLPTTSENELFSFLVFLLFLYKNGYDFRRLAVPEEYFFENTKKYKEVFSTSVKKQNLTDWLEYISQAISYQLQKTIRDIDFKEKDDQININFFELNERQKNILSLFDKPDNKISNKTVMKRFKISSVTASRDLSKLANLGLLLTIGKGRSTYYIKV